MLSVSEELVWSCYSDFLYDMIDQNLEQIDLSLRELDVHVKELYDYAYMLK